jgi:antirestriction protein
MNHEQTVDRRAPPRGDQPELVEQDRALHPEIWVGAVADYEGERRYGAWLDATQDETELTAGIREVLERTPDPGGQEWGIFDTRGFGYWQPDRKYGLPTVVQVALGIVEHGLPYSALVQAVGAESLGARPDRFDGSFLGDWPSMKHFAEQVAAESGWYEHVSRLPENMRPYVRLDTARLARDARRDLTVVERPDGVWVFDPRVW